MSKALELAHNGGDDQAVFQQYVLYGEQREHCATWPWVFGRLLSKDLFELEGKTTVYSTFAFLILSTYTSDDDRARFPFNFRCLASFTSMDVSNNADYSADSNRGSYSNCDPKSGSTRRRS
jgi:hypothetical protein